MLVPCQTFYKPINFIMRIRFYAACVIAYLLLSTTQTFAQTGTYGNNVLTEMPNTPIDSSINGYIVVKPVDYNSSKKYPLLIFLEGQNQFGNGSPAELKNLYGNSGVSMFPDIVTSNNFPNNYTVGGTTYEFIVLIPQARFQVKHDRASPDQMLSPGEVNDIVNYSLQNFSVDANRVYLMGLSLGGGSTWNYPGQSQSYGNRLAAIVPFAGASNLNDNHSRVINIAQANLPVWTFAVSTDQPYAQLAQDYIDSIHTHAEHTTEALITTYSSGSHEDAWENPLLRNSTGQSAHPNLYQWMLGYALGLNGRTALPQPVFASVSAGSDQTLNLSNGSMALSANGISFNGATVNLNGSASMQAGGQPISTIQWTRVDGNGGYIASPNSLSTTVTGLKPGNYAFQLRITDASGLVSVSTVHVTVNAPQDNSYTRIGMDKYSALSTTTGSPQIDYTFQDQGPIYGMGYWDAGRWAEYTVNNLTAGSYALYYRYNSLYGNPSLQISSGITTVTRSLSTTPSDNVWRSDSIHIDLAANPTIRFTALSNGSSTNMNLDYFELAQLGSSSSSPAPTVSAGANQTITLPADSVTLTGSAKANNGGSISSYKWSQSSGPSTANIVSPSTASTLVRNMVEGTYVFSLMATDNNGSNATSSVSVTVNPAPTPPPTTTGTTQIEAENYIAMNSVATETTTDTGGGLDVGYIGAGSWMDYSLNMSAAGTYPLSFRLASPNGGQLQVRNSSGTVLATVSIPATGGWQSWQTVTASITLPSGAQTIRIYATTNGWNFNWFEIGATSGAVTMQSVNGAAQVQSLTTETGLDVYPNPIASNFRLRINNGATGQVNVQIYNMSGVLQKQFLVFKPDNSATQFYLSIGAIATGNYIIKVTMKGWTDSKTIVKQ